MVGTYDKVSQQVTKLQNAEKRLSEELSTSNTNAQNLLDSLLNIKDVTFGGESEAGLDIAKQKESIRLLELQIAKGTDLQAIFASEDAVTTQEEKISLMKSSEEALRAELRLLEDREDAGEDITDQITAQQTKLDEYLKSMDVEEKRLNDLKKSHERLLDTQKELERQLEAEEQKLEILRLKQQEFDNERAIQAQQNRIDLENLGELQTVTAEQFQEDQAQKIRSLNDERDKQDEIRNQILDTQARSAELVAIFSVGQEIKEAGYDAEQQSIRDLIRETDNLISKYKEAVDARGQLLGKQDQGSGGGFWNSIWEPVQQVIDTVDSFFKAGSKKKGGQTSEEAGTILKLGAPNKEVQYLNDFILTSKGDIIKPSPQDTIIGTKNPNGMGGGITVHIETLQGLDPDSIAEALESKLRTLIRV